MTRINCYIFARGGSRRLPGKNLLHISGRSLLAHAIEHAKGVTENVYVSTDSPAISREAIKYGAKVIERPEELSHGGQGSEWNAWRHALANSPECDIFVSVPCTCPLRYTTDIERTIAGLNNFDACVTVSHLVVHRFGMPSIRSQDLKPIKNVCGIAYAVKPSHILEHANLWDGVVTNVLVPRERALDIDTQFDFYIAKLLMESTYA